LVLPATFSSALEDDSTASQEGRTSNRDSELFRPVSQRPYRPWYCTTTLIDAGEVLHPEGGMTVNFTGTAVL
jgi:hypothetical protein